MKKTEDIKVVRIGVMKMIWDHMVRTVAQPQEYTTHQ